MERSVFTDRSKKPDNRRLNKAIGESGPHWTAIKAHVLKKHGEALEEWKYYGPKAGWVLKVLLRRRNVFFLTPLKGYFRIAFVFGDRAASTVEKSNVPAAVKKELKETRRYVEGRALRIEVKRQKDVPAVKKLIDIKIAS
ncbi:MAG: DUF3788 family protein [Candidatus Aminicenantes bacterium]|nr:DUF3788 family protein [Candidatus Aminicenantes bacterium]